MTIEIKKVEAFILIASLWGTSMTMLIAGTGFHGADWQEGVVTLGLLLCNAAILSALGIVVAELRKKRVGPDPVAAGD